jgi:RimJ/RimL family protein N-acetyltransferase
MPARLPDDRPLVGRTVRLDRTVADDAAGVHAALDDDAVWASGYNGGPGSRPRSVAVTRDLIEAARASGRAQFSVRLLRDGELGEAGTIVGTTSLGDFELEDEKTHIGWTAYQPSTWGTAVNPECKLLLLTYAFDTLGFGRVKIQTDLINTRSQAAIAKLGATREGVLRRDKKRGDGSWRDTVVFSVIIDEWPEVRANLERRLGH